MQNENGPLAGAVIHLVAGAGLAYVARVRRPRHEPASLSDSQDLSINQHMVHSPSPRYLGLRVESLLKWPWTRVSGPQPGTIIHEQGETRI